MTTTFVAVFSILVLGAGCNSSSSRAAEQREPAKAATPPSSVMKNPMTTHQSSPASVAAAPSAPTAARNLGGGDVYRINCQACHGESGSGTAQAPALTKFARA